MPEGANIDRAFVVRGPDLTRRVRTRAGTGRSRSSKSSSRRSWPLPPLGADSRPRSSTASRRSTMGSNRIRFEADAASTVAGQELVPTSDSSRRGSRPTPRATTDLQMLFQRRMSPDYRVAFNAWAPTDPTNEPECAARPGPMPEYQIRHAERAERPQRRGDRGLHGRHSRPRDRGKYVRNTVLLAMVLFLVALAQRFDDRFRRTAVNVISLLVFDLRRHLRRPTRTHLGARRARMASSTRPAASFAPWPPPAATSPPTCCSPGGRVFVPDHPRVDRHRPGDLPTASWWAGARVTPVEIVDVAGAALTARLHRRPHAPRVDEALGRRVRAQRAAAGAPPRWRPTRTRSPTCSASPASPRSWRPPRTCRSRSACARRAACRRRRSRARAPSCSRPTCARCSRCTARSAWPRS